ncbi:MAG: nucleotidyltransferase family protein [Pseudomonadota bacterium]
MSPDESSLERRFAEILRADPVIRSALCQVERAALPDGWIVAGALYNTVWNVLTGRPPGHGIRDIDVFYFDGSDLSYGAEDQVIRRESRHFAPEPPVEIRNQARVHLWFERHFGHSIEPITSCRDSIARFSAETHAVGARLISGRLEIEAPFGLEAIFGMRLVPNRRSESRASYESKARRVQALWPEVEVLPWPEEAL